MTPQKKADLRLNCVYAAITITGVNRSDSPITKGEVEHSRQPRPTTEKVLDEARKLEKWILGK